MAHRDLYEDNPTSQPEYHYAGFAERLVAIFIDRLIFALIISIVFKGYESGLREFLLRCLITVFGIIAYHVYLETSHMQATIGKMVMNLKVIRVDGQRLSIADSIFRYFGSILSVLSLNIGHLMVLLDTKNRALHDHIAGTYVVKVK